MSYSFSFSQFPTKEFHELWGEFVEGNLSARIEEKIDALKKEEATLENTYTLPRTTFYENREEWMRREKIRERGQLIASHIASWESIKKAFAEDRAKLDVLTNKKDILDTVRISSERFMSLFGTTNPIYPQPLFVSECDGYSETAKGMDYLFLKRLFSRVQGKELDGLNVMPTTEEWHAFYKHLEPDFVRGEFKAFFDEEGVPEHARSEAEKECLHLLFIVRGLLKGCLKNEWDLWFYSEFQTTDIEEKQKKLLAKECAEAFLAHNV